VSVFLGNRDEGALQFLGHAKIGLPSPQSVEGGDPQFAFAGWSLRTPSLKGTGQLVDLHIYARSSVTGVETVDIIPIKLGERNGGGTGAEEEGGPDD
jgi:hypothetical protein